MRLNRYISTSSGVSRREADRLISASRVKINGVLATMGDQVEEMDKVSLDNKQLSLPKEFSLILFNKPVGYVVSREGQGSNTIYDLIPEKYHKLKPIGRLDKDSSGLLLLTDDGELSYKLTHPSLGKEKVYIISVKNKLTPEDIKKLNSGIMLKDGKSNLHVSDLGNSKYEVKISEGRNRQIRRTFEAIDNNVTKLHRTSMGEYFLGSIKSGEYLLV